jgi:hypothetical protein
MSFSRVTRRLASLVLVVSASLGLSMSSEAWASSGTGADQPTRSSNWDREAGAPATTNSSNWDRVAGAPATTNSSNWDRVAGAPVTTNSSNWDRAAGSSNWD